MEKIYLIKDSNGRFDCSMGLCEKNPDGTGLEWVYCSNSHATRCHTRLEVAQRELQKLQELNSIANYNVDFSIVEFEGKDMNEVKAKAPITHWFGGEHEFEFKDIPKGCKGKTKKAVRENRNKYKKIEKLQRALDNQDKDKISEILASIYTDYDQRYVDTLIAYNQECDIKALDLVNFKQFYPNAKFFSLFLFDESVIKALCSLDNKKSPTLNGQDSDLLTIKISML